MYMEAAHDKLSPQSPPCLARLGLPEDFKMITDRYNIQATAVYGKVDDAVKSIQEAVLEAAPIMASIASRMSVVEPILSVLDISLLRKLQGDIAKIVQVQDEIGKVALGLDALAKYRQAADLGPGQASPQDLGDFHDSMRELPDGCEIKSFCLHLRACLEGANNAAKAEFQNPTNLEQ